MMERTTLLKKKKLEIRPERHSLSPKILTFFEVLTKMLQH